MRDYTHHLKPGPGYSAGVDIQLQSAANLDKCEEREKHVLLLLDEMHVKQDHKNTGELLGFVNLGDINMHLLALEKSMSSSPDESIEPTVLAFMVKGLFSHLEFPYAHFPCRNLTADLMLPVLGGRISAREAGIEGAYRFRRLFFSDDSER